MPAASCCVQQADQLSGLSLLLLSGLVPDWLVCMLPKFAVRPSLPRNRRVSLNELPAKAVLSMLICTSWAFSCKVSLILCDLIQTSALHHICEQW